MFATEVEFPLWWSCVKSPAGAIVSWTYRFDKKVRQGDRFVTRKQVGVPLFKSYDDAGAYRPERPTQFLDTHPLAITDQFELANFLSFLESENPSHDVFFMYDFKSRNDYEILQGDIIREFEERTRGPVKFKVSEVERVRVAAWNSIFSPDTRPQDISSEQRVACTTVSGALACSMGVTDHGRRDFDENLVVSYRGTPNPPTTAELESVARAFYDEAGLTREKLSAPRQIGPRNVLFIRNVDLGLKLA